MQIFPTKQRVINKNTSMDGNYTQMQNLNIESVGSATEGLFQTAHNPYGVGPCSADNIGQMDMHVLHAST